MNCKNIPLEELCSITAGTSISRAKTPPKTKEPQEEQRPCDIKVLIPKAMQDNRVVEEYLATETIYKVKDETLTQEGDVILKTTTPYDCVYIDKEHKGLFVTTFGFILRPLPKAEVDMRYLSICLNSEMARKQLQQMAQGEGIQALKKKDISKLELPIANDNAQEKIVLLFEKTQATKALCTKISELSDLLLASEFATSVIGA